MKPLKRVEVEWVDSAFCRGWQDIDDKRKYQRVAHCWSVGYLLDQNAHEVRLVSSHDRENDTVADGLTIPRVAVKRIRTIK